MLADIPFDTTQRRNWSDVRSEDVLTGYVGGGTEFGSHGRIHLDHNLLLLSHQGVPFFDLLRDPCPKVITNHGSTNIHNPLFGDLREVLWIWEVIGDLRPCADEVGDTLERQILILRNVDGLDLTVVEIGLLGAQDVLQKVDRDIL